MKQWAFFFFGLASFSALAAQTYTVDAQVFFSPDGGCQDAIIKEITNAKESIYGQAFLFTNKPIAEALVGAKKRGVIVSILIDHNGAKKPRAKAMLVHAGGVETRIDDQHATAHDKLFIIDKKTVITGSYNFTQKAEHKNAENLLILRSEALAKTYWRNWKRHYEHATALKD